MLYSLQGEADGDPCTMKHQDATPKVEREQQHLTSASRARARAAIRVRLYRPVFSGYLVVALSSAISTSYLCGSR